MISICMIKERVCLSGSRSKGAVTGVSLAFDLLVKGFEEAKIPFCVVDTTFCGGVARSGTFSFRRSLETVLVIVWVWWSLLFCRTLYATMSTSPFGFVRDYFSVGFAKLLGRKTVLHLHGGGFEDFYLSQSPFVQSLIRSHLRRVDKVIVLGELLKEQFYVAGDFISERLVVVPNGLTLGVEEPEFGCAKSLPSSSEPIQLLYLSSLMPTKGFMDVLRAMVDLRQAFPGRYHLHLCGSFVDASTEQRAEVTDVASLEQFLQAESLNDSVTYHGQVLGEAKMERFRLAHVFLLPTYYPWEGQPLSIIEAMAYGTPVISTNHKGIPEQILDEITGLFVEPRSPESIVSALQRISESNAGYVQMSGAARKLYEERFTRDVHLQRLMDEVLS